MNRTRNWHYTLKNINRAQILDSNNHNLKNVILACEHACFRLYTDKWKKELNRERARRGNEHNKLRTYRTFKSNF